MMAKSCCPGLIRSLPVMDGNFNDLFSERRYIARAPSLSNAAELSKSCGLVGVLDGRVGGGAEIAPVGRAQSERRRRLALAGGFRLLRSSGIDRLDALARAAAPQVGRPR